MFPKDDPDAVAGVEKMFAEIDRILKFAGRYICFSLLQEHILGHYVHWFENLVIVFFRASKETPLLLLVIFLKIQGWSVRILRCREFTEADGLEEWKFPVFALIVTKFKKMPNMQAVRMNIPSLSSL